MPRVFQRLQRRAVILLAALLLAFAPVTASATAGSQPERTPSALVLVTVPIAAQVSTVRSSAAARGQQAIGTERLSVAPSPGSARRRQAAPRLPATRSGRYHYLEYCALLC